MHSVIIAAFASLFLNTIACSPAGTSVSKADPVSSSGGSSSGLRSPGEGRSPADGGPPAAGDEWIRPAPARSAEECQRFIERLPGNFRRGYVVVPENWSQPEGRKIRVFYYFDPGVAPAPAGPVRHATPVVFFNGGPAMDSHAAYETFSALRQTGFPMVFIDQRGTGCSDPYPSQVDAETAERLAHYGTRAIVRDAEAIRRELVGPRAWNVFGQSSGGEIVYRYIEMAPEAVRSAFVHGASLMADPIEWLKLRLLSQRRVSGEYFRRYPGDEALLAEARSMIRPDTCFTDGSSRICGPSVMDGTALYLGYRNSWQALHHQINGFFLTNPDGTRRGLNRAEVRRFVRNTVFGVFLQNDFAASVITQREKLAGVRESDPSDPLGCRRAEERLAGMGLHPAQWPINECRVLGAAQSPWDDAARSVSGADPISLERVKLSLRRHSGIDLFVYAGDLDTFSPRESFAEMQRFLGDYMTFRLLQGSGHEGYYTDPIIRQDVARFLHPLVDYPDFGPDDRDLPF